MKRMTTAIITNIQGFSIHDGPGIRTVVFFKGCSLACQWCANPECIEPRTAIGFLASHCQGCGKCSEVCQFDAINPEATEFRIKLDKCSACGDCVDNCLYEALVSYGEEMTVETVWENVCRDKMFYDSSGGGVTVSGGEPLLHPAFVRELFEQCSGARINTCVETCGFVKQSAIEQVFPLTDLFLFDLKHVDSPLHQQFTGQLNEVILDNAKWLVQQQANILFRHPLIPGVNDSLAHIEQLAGFLNHFDEPFRKLELMPYHRVGSDKYMALGLTYCLSETQIMRPEEVEAIKKAYGDRGVDCSISK